METVTNELLDDLLRERDHELADGRIVRFRWEPDQDGSLMDEQGEGMWCGKLAWVQYDRDTGQSIRPDGFTGAAEVIRPAGGNVWWEVPDDLRTPDMAESKRSVRSSIVNLLDYGYHVAIVEVCKGVDAYGRPIVVEVATLGGVEAFPGDDYTQAIIRDLLAELSLEN